MEDQTLGRDAQMALFAAMSLNQLAFDERELMATLLGRVSHFLGDTIGSGLAPRMENVPKEISANFRTVCGSVEAARERLLRAARACLDDPEDSDEEAKFLMDVAALSPESPSSLVATTGEAPEPAPAIAAADPADLTPEKTGRPFYFILCEPRTLKPGNAAEFLAELREWATLLELCLDDPGLERRAVVGLVMDLREGLEAAESVLRSGQPLELHANDEPDVGDWHNFTRDLLELATVKPEGGWGEAGRELAKAQLRRRRELEDQARKAGQEQQPDA